MAPSELPPSGPSSGPPKPSNLRRLVYLAVGVAVVAWIVFALRPEEDAKDTADRKDEPAREAKVDRDEPERASTKSRGGLFGGWNPFSRHPANDGKICIQVHAEGQPDRTETLLVAKLREEGPKWDVSTSDAPAKCTPDFFVTVLATDVTTSRYEWGVFQNTVHTFEGYTASLAFLAPAHQLGPYILTSSGSRLGDVVDLVGENFAKFVNESGPGRAKTQKSTGADDGKNCVHLEAASEQSHHAAAELLTSSRRNIWIIDHSPDTTEKSCPPDFYMSYYLMALDNLQGQTEAYATTFAVKGAGDFPGLSLGTHRNQNQSQVLSANIILEPFK